MRTSFDLDRASAVNVAEWRVAQLAKDPSVPMMKKMALQAALSGGYLKEIFDEVYGLGFCISGDKNNPLHQQMLQAGSIREVK